MTNHVQLTRTKRLNEERINDVLEERLNEVHAHIRSQKTTPKPEGYLGVYCKTCKQDALPMRDGTCGFCDTKIAEPEPFNCGHSKDPENTYSAGDGKAGCRTCNRARKRQPVLAVRPN